MSLSRTVKTIVEIPTIRERLIRAKRALVLTEASLAGILAELGESDCSEALRAVLDEVRHADDDVYFALEGPAGALDAYAPSETSDIEWLRQQEKGGAQ